MNWAKDEVDFSICLMYSFTSLTYHMCVVCDVCFVSGLYMKMCVCMMGHRKLHNRVLESDVAGTLGVNEANTFVNNQVVVQDLHLA